MSDWAEILSGMFTQMWRLLTGWKLPGINVTPAMLMFFPLYVTVVKKFIFEVINVSGSGKGDDVKK